jgi:hypothetical protein
VITLRYSRRLALACILCAWASAARAQTIDGSITQAEYGTPLATQTNGTGFGNNGNELNALYAKSQFDGSLRLGLTGNLETNGNGLVIFIDSRAGGGIASTLPGGWGVLGSIPGRTVDDWGTDIDGDTGVNPTPGGGSILPVGFNPDFAIELNANSNDSSYFINVIDLTLANTPVSPDNRDIFLGSNLINGTSVVQTYFRDNGTLPSGTIEHAFNNSNTQGVDDFPSVGDPLTATTGMEFDFSAAFLGQNQPTIKLMAFITNGSGDFLSNQLLPGLPEGYGNLGGAEVNSPLYDASTTPGAAVVSIPEPGMLGLILLMLPLVLRGRTRHGSAGMGMISSVSL